MVEAVAEMLLVQRGKELGYKMSDEQFKQAVDNIKKEYKLDTDEKFQAALKQENMTMADLRRQFERSMLVQRVEQIEVFGKIAISEDEARKYYEAHLDGVHDAGRGHAARNPRGAAQRRQRAHRRSGRGREGEGRADSRMARVGRRELHEAGRRFLRRALARRTPG